MRRQIKPADILSTAEAQQWLTQFDVVDRPIAARLIEGLKLFTQTVLEQELTNLILTERAKLGKPAVALFAMREQDPDISLLEYSQTHSTETTLPVKGRKMRFGGKRVLLEPRLYKKIKESGGIYFPNDSSVRPDAVRQGSGVGSEGFLSGLIRDIETREGINKFLDHPSKDMMKKVGCQHILLIDDVIGSGSRATDFVDGFFGGHTGRRLLSLHSYGIIDVRVLAHSGTQEGVKITQSHRLIKEVKVQHLLQKKSPIWSSSDYLDIKNICKKYASRTSRYSIPLGYKDAFTRVIYEHKCPNTAPAILWAAQRGHWSSLFRTRPRLDLKPEVWPEPVDRTQLNEKILATIGQKSLSKIGWQKYFSPIGRDCIMLLAALSKCPRKIEIISGYLGISIMRCRQLSQLCTRNGWITIGLRLTEIGLRELSYARSLKVLPEKVLSINNEFYFPKSLREPGSSSSAGRQTSADTKKGS